MFLSSALEWQAEQNTLCEQEEYEKVRWQVDLYLYLLSFPKTLGTKSLA